MLRDGQADVLVAAKLDRLSRSLLDFASLLERARQEKWALVALDSPVDTSAPHGEMLAGVLAVFAQFERRLIGQRTRDALAVRRAQGVVLGRPPTVPRNVERRIQRARSAGTSFRVIAERLNADGLPPAHGGKQWYPGTVRSIHLRLQRGHA
jgi:DNA invertase Pin-like site-specific DNA recombinase